MRSLLEGRSGHCRAVKAAQSIRRERHGVAPVRPLSGLDERQLQPPDVLPVQHLPQLPVLSLFPCQHHLQIVGGPASEACICVAGMRPHQKAFTPPSRYASPPPLPFSSSPQSAPFLWRQGLLGLSSCLLRESPVQTTVGAHKLLLVEMVYPPSVSQPLAPSQSICTHPLIHASQFCTRCSCG